MNITSKQFTNGLFKTILIDMLATKDRMTNGILQARSKDYTNPYRKMVYDNEKEMLKVIGKLEDNNFIQEQFAQFDQLKKRVNLLIKKWKL